MDNPCTSEGRLGSLLSPTTLQGVLQPYQLPDPAMCTCPGILVLGPWHLLFLLLCWSLPLLASVFALFFAPHPLYLSLSLSVSISCYLSLCNSFLVSASLTLVFLFPLSLPFSCLYFSPVDFLKAFPTPDSGGAWRILSRTGTGTPSALSLLRHRTAGPAPFSFH